MPNVAPADVAVRPRRSAFAAAFLSFIFPGLGHAYLRRWLRALLWAALPLIGIAALANMAVANLAGTGIPILLDRLGQDPALASNIFLTLVTDMVGFAGFLGIASLLL